jgi:phosphate transport system permease protein
MNAPWVIRLLLGTRAPGPERRDVNWGDRAFRWIAALFAVAAGAVLLLVVAEMFRAALPSLRRLGLGFLISSSWDPVRERFGALPFLWGTLVSSGLALLIAVPVALGVAIYLSELAPARLRRPLGALVELLAAIPSVIYGLWGLFVLAPWLRRTAEPLLERSLGSLPLIGALFAGPHLGVGILAGGLVLAIMVLPTIASVSRDVLRSIPDSFREGALALGATRREMVRVVLLPAARSGLVGAVVLGLGRALGETMAVTMVIGNRAEISASLFAPAATMASVVANEFTEATSDVHLAALYEIGLVLFAVTLLLNVTAQWLVRRRPGPLRAPRLRLSRSAGARREGASPQRRRWSNRVFQAECLGATGLALLPLASVLALVAARALPVLSWELLTELPRPVGAGGGGLANAIVGSLMLLFVAGAVGVPVGVLAGLYLGELGRGRVASGVRFSLDVLAGMPSIVIGIFVYSLVVVPMRGFSALAGGMALAILMLPTIARATEEIVRLVPETLREAALALGVPRWRATLRVVVRVAAPGILTGVLLALGRAAGETAPLLFTAFGNRGFGEGLHAPVASLPQQILVYAISPYQAWHGLAWAAAFLLISLVLLLHLAARLLVREGARPT